MKAFPLHLSSHAAISRRKRPLPGTRSTSTSIDEDSSFDSSDTTRPSTSTTAVYSESSYSSARRNLLVFPIPEPPPPPTLSRTVSRASSTVKGAHWSVRETYAKHRQQRSSESGNTLELLISPPITATFGGRTARGLSDPQGLRRGANRTSPITAPGSTSYGGEAVGGSMTNGHQPATSVSHNAVAMYQQIQDLSSKRISTLDYLRKAHEGHVYWLTAFQFQKADLAKLPYFEARKLARRATNYLLLGLSIPAILDPNSDTALEYLRAFHALLTEFESYQSIHSPDGQSTGSLGRGRIPQMFKRATQGSGPRNKRASSSAANDPWSPVNSNDSPEARSASGSHNAASTSTLHPSFPAPDQDLLPGEEYTFLLTPFLPFEPDYFETFATLCDVLIDCYTKVMALTNSPEVCEPPGIGELFSKADSKVRKILIAGLVQDFEDATKQGIKSELAGVGKVVLGGLM